MMNEPKIISGKTAMLFFGVLIILLSFNFSSCKKAETPENPYDSVNYNTGKDTIPEPDPNSITGLHKNIFSKRCANPGCHDGTFEPDFRTVQSSFSTLVYMPVNKLTVDNLNYFETRVIPGDYLKSFLYERLTTGTSDYMPSNGGRLTDLEIDHVKTWIMNGAKDVNGLAPQKPNLPPDVKFYFAFNAAQQRIDTIRSGGVSYHPFVAPANSIIYIPFQALDTADGNAATDPSLFTVHKIKFSTDKNDFSSSITVNATWQSPFPFSYWQTIINTASWPSGTTVYFRIYVNDGFQINDTEFPKTITLDYYKTYYAFLVQ
jgi:hypothetical protein